MTAQEIDMKAFEELKQASGAEFIGELVDTFLADAPNLIAELRLALKTGDPDTFRRVAHSLKSNGATFGAMRFSLQAKDLELLGKERRLAEVGDRLNQLEATFAKTASELKELRV